jgi:hypothetical protein
MVRYTFNRFEDPKTLPTQISFPVWEAPEPYSADRMPLST